MKRTIQSWLNSGLTPIVCLVIMFIENHFTYDIPGAWLFRVLELMICVLGLVAAVRNYSSWFRAAAVFFLAVGVLSAAVDLPRNIREARDGTETRNSDYVAASSGTSASYAGTSNQYVYSGYGYNDNWSTNTIQSTSEKVVCHACNGSKTCKECDGTGRIAIQKQSIDLGGGGSTYNVYKTCALCNGDKKCYWCHGTGYEPFS